jgi:hypothetical protein
MAPPKTPTLFTRSSLAIEHQWKAVKRVKEHKKRRELIAHKKLERQYCIDVLDAAEWLRRSTLALQLRDTTRYRTAIRPEMVATLLAALRIFGVSDPNKRLSLGDVSQPGCGQIRYGTLVRFVAQNARKEFQKQATFRWGKWQWSRPFSPNEFIDEYPRFAHLYGPIWVEDVLTGETTDGTARVERRRFFGGAIVDDRTRHKLLLRVRRRMQNRGRLEWDWVRHAGKDGKIRRHRRVRWTNTEHSYWMEAIWRHRARRRATAWTLLRVREANIDASKPGSRRDERRYLFNLDGEAGVQVRKFGLLYEAHHSSHLGGLDADISYVTKSNGGHFDTNEALDAAATWRWLNAIHEGSQKVGVRIKALFVDSKIMSMLRNVPQAKAALPIWRKLKRSPGHDSHVHLRLASNKRFSTMDLDTLTQYVNVLFEKAHH